MHNERGHGHHRKGRRGSRTLGEAERPLPFVAKKALGVMGNRSRLRVLLPLTFSIAGCSPVLQGSSVTPKSPVAPATDPGAISRRFVAAINAHDVDSLVSLMSPQYVFVDSLGVRYPFQVAREGWTQYFAMVPDYRIEVDQVTVEGNSVLLMGKAAGTFVPAGGAVEAKNRWETPAAWKALVQGGRLTLWQVFSDNEPIRQVMRAAASPTTSRATGIGGVFFKATDPKKLTAWYVEQLGFPPPKYGVRFAWREEDGGPGSTTWAIFPRNSTYFDPTVAPFMINYRVKNLDEVLARLRRAGARVDEKIDQEDNGRFCWAVDPEGNRFELWEPKTGY